MGLDLNLPHLRDPHMCPTAGGQKQRGELRRMWIVDASREIRRCSCTGMWAYNLHERVDTCSCTVHCATPKLIH
jgi:hypothetical protein